MIEFNCKLNRHVRHFAIVRFQQSGAHQTTHVAAASATDRVTHAIAPTATQRFNVYARWAGEGANRPWLCCLIFW